jgi:MFS transporter, MHS family, proline/betaine transporter
LRTTCLERWAYAIITQRFGGRESGVNKTILAAGIGSLLEWAEFTFYAYMVLTFATLFFPHLSHQIAVLAGFSVFAVSYLARPLGAILFGHLGDRYGRKRALAYSIFLMGWVTLGIGVLPTYQQIGVGAPVLLVILRFLQGVAVAGESSGAAVFVIEHHPIKPRFYSSWVSTFAAGGMLLGSFAAFIVSLPSMPPWAWRMPFVMGFIVCFVGYYLRDHLMETTDFTSAASIKKLVAWPLIDVFNIHRKALFKTMILAAFICVYIYICNVWWVSYAIEQQYFSSTSARLLSVMGQGCVVIFTPLSALIADRFPKIPVMRIGFFASILVCHLLFIATAHQNMALIIAMQVAYAFSNALVTGSTFYYLSQLFPVNVRYSGQAIGWNIAAALFGGTAPLVAQYMVTSMSWQAGPAFYVTIFSSLALLVV